MEVKTHYDYVVAGSGLAGLYVALRAAKYGTVALLTKSWVRESNSYYAQGGLPLSLIRTIALACTTPIPSRRVGACAIAQRWRCLSTKRLSVSRS